VKVWLILYQYMARVNVSRQDCPAQQNMHDCGVFTCKHAEVLARGRELSFTQADMPIIRYRMVAELLAGELGVA